MCDLFCVRVAAPGAVSGQFFDKQPQVKSQGGEMFRHDGLGGATNFHQVPQRPLTGFLPDGLAGPA
jgi:hypothetical protein